jgi:hypothetical protein
MSDSSTGDTTYEIKVADGGYIDGLTVIEDDGTSADYAFRYENEAELEASRIAAAAAAESANAAKAAIEANEEARKTAEDERAAKEAQRQSGFSASKKACDEQTALAKSATDQARQSKAAADDAAARANAAAAAAKPYYIQQAEPERTKRVDGMLWVKVNESKKSVDALARWDAGKTGNAIFPGEQTVPGNKTVVDIPGAWTLFDDHRIA